MQDKKERPPILEKYVKRDNPVVAGPQPEFVRHVPDLTDDEPAGYNPYDKPPPLVTTTRRKSPLAHRLRSKRDG